MSFHKKNNKNKQSQSITSETEIELLDYARAFNVVSETPEFEEIIDNACLAQEHTSQIIASDRNDLSHTGSCLQKEKNILTAINGINPNDTVEAMLASQMITTHNAAMKAFAKAESYNMRNDIAYKKLSIASACLGNKLMRTYTMQMDSLNRYRGKGQQKITVEYLNINEGGKAIVGNVSSQKFNKGRG